MLSEPVIIFAPFPPSTNTIYPASSGHRHFSKKAARYKKDIQDQFMRRYPGFKMVPRHSPLCAILDLWPPDHRKRDVDNYAKLLIDSLTGLIYEDDRQIKKLLIEMHDVDPPGSAIIHFGKVEDFEEHTKGPRDSGAGEK